MNGENLVGMCCGFLCVCLPLKNPVTNSALEKKPADEKSTDEQSTDEKSIDEKSGFEKCTDETTTDETAYSPRGV